MLQILINSPNRRSRLGQPLVDERFSARFGYFTAEGPRDPNGGVKVVELGTDHRLSLAQNAVLLAGQIAILLASCIR